jgi:small subunit ribosomal protein S20
MTEIPRERRGVSRRKRLPQKKSTVKRLRQTKKLNARNQAVKSRVATAVRRARESGPDAREAALRRAIAEIDKAVKAGVYKKETASRKKSRLMKSLREAA